MPHSILVQNDAKSSPGCTSSSSAHFSFKFYSKNDVLLGSAGQTEVFGEISCYLNKKQQIALTKKNNLGFLKEFNLPKIVKYNKHKKDILISEILN